MKIMNGKTRKPRKVLLYGGDGTGKSTLAANAPNSLFIDIEDGLNDINCMKTPQLKTYAEFTTVLLDLVHEKTKFDWIAIDSLDWLETLVWVDVAKEADKPSIADIGYGAGYKQAMIKWQYIARALDYLRLQRNCGIILIAHAQVKRFESPEHDAYDRYQPALHDLASALWREWCDEVFFASFRVYTRKEDKGFSGERTVALGGNERYLRTQETAAVVAKNRLSLPAEIPMDWAVYQAAIDESVSAAPVNTKKEKVTV